MVAASPQILKKRGAAGAAGCVEELHRFRSGGDSGSAAEGCGLPLCGNAYKVSVTGLTFSVIWQNNHSADWLAALANRVEIIHPSHTTVRTVRYTAVQFLGQIIFS